MYKLHVRTYVCMYVCMYVCVCMCYEWIYVCTYQSCHGPKDRRVCTSRSAQRALSHPWFTTVFTLLAQKLTLTFPHSFKLQRHQFFQNISGISNMSTPAWWRTAVQCCWCMEFMNLKKKVYVYCRVTVGLTQAILQVFKRDSSPCYVMFLRTTFGLVEISDILLQLSNPHKLK